MPDGEVRVAIDGVWYGRYAPASVPHCGKYIARNVFTSRKTVGNAVSSTTYCHDVMAATIVKYDSRVVLPLSPEFIRNADGSEKQDCDRNAAKRYIKTREEQLKALNPVFLGDDLYACHSICKEILDRGMSLTDFSPPSPARTTATRG
jgi:hypothetical protein